MGDKALICIIKDNTYRHPIYFTQGTEPKLIGYVPVEELSEELSRYSSIYQTNKVILDGNRNYMAGIREIINHENIAKYGINNLDIQIPAGKE